MNTDYARIDAMPEATLNRLPPATLTTLDRLLAPSSAQQPADFYDGELHGALFGLFYTCQFTDEKIAAARAALAEMGYVAPEGELTKADVLAAMDTITDSVPWNARPFENRLLYGVAVALAASEPYAAYTMLDGPEGAGIGWDLTRQELGATIEANEPTTSH